MAESLCQTISLSPMDREILAGFQADQEALKRAAEQKNQKAVLPPLRCVNARELVDMRLPERTFLLDPLIAVQSLSMVFAARGIGKTFFALTIAAGIATGSRVFGRWSPPRPATVLYVDGEMPAVSLQERVRHILLGMDSQEGAANLRFLTPDLQERAMPNLATQEGQETLAPFLDGVDLLVMDNIATLARTGKANDEDSWLPVQEWLLQLRRRGLSVLLVHHAGKNGSQRGTGAKEDILDSVLELKRPSGYQMEQGCCFEVHFTKARGLTGKDTQPFEATISVDITGQACWQTRLVEDVVETKVLELLQLDGMSELAIAEELGVSRSTVSRVKRRLRERGESLPELRRGPKKSRVQS